MDIVLEMKKITKKPIKRRYTSNRLKPPAKWVMKIRHEGIRNLVEQEYYISPSRALKISKAKSVKEAKRIRAELLDSEITSRCSVSTLEFIINTFHNGLKDRGLKRVENE